MIRYREFEIRYNDPGVTILRHVTGYGPSVVYRKEFTSLFDGLNYLLERLAATENSDLDQVVKHLRTIKSDLISIIKKMPVNHEKEQVPENNVKAVPQNTAEACTLFPIEPKTLKKIIRRPV